MKAYNSTLILSIISTAVLSCGKATIEPQNESYEPRIVIEGFLEADQNIDRIFITRNFTVNTNLNRFDLLPDPDVTEVKVTALKSNQVIPLSFHLEEREHMTEAYWRCEDPDIIVRIGESYRLDVTTAIDGNRLTASAVTKVPQPGFRINNINYDQLQYRQKNDQGELLKFNISFSRSVGASFYLAAIQAQNPQQENFIYDNPYHDIKPEDVDLIDDAFNYEAVHHAPMTAGESQLPLGWEEFRFYDRYKIILYATDENYKDFFITYRDVMEMDGNFHEAKFNMEGDGIGVFGSVSADTVYCTVTR